MTLPRILSAVGRTLAVLGVVTLLFVVFQLWGTGLQQAQAQGNLEGDLAERFRLAAEAGQAAHRPAGATPQIATAAESGESPDSAAGATAAVAQPASGNSGPQVAPQPASGAGRPAPTITPSAATETGPAPADPPSASPAEGVEPIAGGEGAAASDAPLPDGSAMPVSADEEATAGTAEVIGAERPPPVTLPELPSVAQVVSHISQPAASRSVARMLAPDVEEMLPLVYPDAGEAIARLIIPSIDLDEIVVAGVEVEDLRKGPGHYRTTPLPGQPGNAAIAGHRTTYGAPFGRIAELNAGDAIILETLQGRFVYRVLPGQPGMGGNTRGYRIVAPTALEVLDDVGDNRLTLTSCHPKYSSRQRIIVHATLVGDPVVRLPRPGEPVGAEYVQLAAPEGPPPVPLNGAAPQAPAPREAATGMSAREAGARETSGPEEGHQEMSGPEAGGRASEGTSGSPGTAPELNAGETAVESGAPAPPDPGTAEGDRGDDTATAAPEAEPPSPEPAPRTPPGGEDDPARTGEAPGVSGSAEEVRQASQASAVPVTEAGFGEGLSGDHGAILPAVLWGLAAAAVCGLGRAFGRSGRRVLRYTVAVVPFLGVLYVMFGYVDRALPAY